MTNWLVIGEQTNSSVVAEQMKLLITMQKRVTRQQETAKTSIKEIKRKSKSIICFLSESNSNSFNLTFWEKFNG